MKTRSDEIIITVYKNYLKKIKTKDLTVIYKITYIDNLVKKINLLIFDITK